MIKHSLATWCFSALQDFDAAAFFTAASKIGYQGAEMVPADMQQQALDAGLELVNSSGSGKEVGLNHEENHEKLIPELITELKTAQKAGVGAVIVFSGNRNGQDDKTGIENCVTAFRQIIPIAEDLGVDLHFEMFNTDDHPGYAASSTRYGLDVWERVAHPRFKILYDAYHMEVMGENVLEDLQNYSEAIGHIHCAAKQGRRSIISSNSLDYRKIVQILETKGYSGYLGQEFILEPGRDQFTALEELRQCIDILRGSD